MYCIFFLVKKHVPNNLLTSELSCLKIYIVMHTKSIIQTKEKKLLLISFSHHEPNREQQKKFIP
jgi:hypothetical protein